MSTSAEERQRAYYAMTASEYDEMHTSDETDEHYVALDFIDMVCSRLGLESILDVGAGTGRGVRFLSSRGRSVRGIEPVKALIERAEAQGVEKGLIVEGSGYSLPFEDNSFDAVIECGVLHHVAEPARVVTEMMRVAKRAIFLSDSNRFGQGSYLARLVKLALYKLNLWHAARFMLTGGKMFTTSEGDGLAYSYSVFDSYAQLAGWANTTWLIPTLQQKGLASWLHPLITSSHVLMCTIKSAGPDTGLDATRKQVATPQAPHRPPADGSVPSC